MIPIHRPGLTGEVKDYPPYWFCSCGSGWPLPTGLIDGYFTGAIHSCPKCEREWSVWDIIRNTFAVPFSFHFFGSLGARSLLCQTKLFLLEQMHLDLREHNIIPPDSWIVDIHFTSRDMFCLEMAGGSRRQTTSDFQNPHIQLYGIRVNPEIKYKTNEGLLDIFITYLPKASHNVSWKNLVNAFDFFAREDYEGCIIPANVAIESSLNPAISSYLGGISSNKRVDDFLKNRATYSYQLNVLLPLAGRDLSFSFLLGDKIIGLLNKLRGFRNDLAHLGHLQEAFDKEACSEMLTAVVFAFRYIQLFKSAVDAKYNRPAT